MTPHKSPRSTVAALPAPASYALDVCRYCGRLAVWPGCPHWQAHGGWTITVTARLSDAERRRLQEAMDA